MVICKIENKIVGWKIEKVIKSTVSLGNRPDKITHSTAPKRPQELIGDIKKVKVQGEQWTIFVGLFNSQPYEIFGGLSRYVDIANRHKTAKIIKGGKREGLSVYNAILGEGDDQMVVKDITSVFENATNGAFSRTISLSLRHGVPVQYIVEQLQKDKHSDVTSYSKVMSRVLKGYIIDGTTSASEKNCPSCKAENTLIYQAGCLDCKSCGWTKC